MSSTTSIDAKGELMENDRGTHAADPAATIAALQAEVAELRRRIEAQEQRSTSIGAFARSRIPVASPSEPTIDRRLLIKSVGVAAGAMGAAVLTGGTAAPASAATGDPIVAGQETDADQTTALASTNSTDGLPGFIVLIGDGIDGLAVDNSAICGMVFTIDDPGPAQFGVAGLSNSGAGGMFSDWGSQAGTGSSAIRLAANFAQIRFDTSEQTPPNPVSQTTARFAGELVFDSSNELWLCVESGSPGTWKKLAGPTTLGQLTLLDAPARIYDSRLGHPPMNVTKSPLVEGEERGLSALVGQHVPLGATAIVCNITVVNTSKNGWLSVYPANTPFPGTSTLNWFQTSSVVANAAIVKLDESGFFTVRCGGGGSTDLVIDVTGYWSD